MTRPRRAVLAALAGHPEHLRVEQGAQAVAVLDPSVHLASVYRALEALTRLGVVQHVHLGHGTTAYHLVADHGQHPHAQCRRCGTVWDLPVDILESVAQRLSAERDFVLDPTHAALSGVCAQCWRRG
jgi:Fe2+ or Zn2+ uptake regulation protein